MGHIGMHLYACILNTDEKDMAEAHTIVDAIQNEETIDLSESFRDN